MFFHLSLTWAWCKLIIRLDTLFLWTRNTFQNHLPSYNRFVLEICSTQWLCLSCVIWIPDIHSATSCLSVDKHPSSKDTSIIQRNTFVSRGQFLEGPETFSYPENRSKISNPMNMLLFYLGMTYDQKFPSYKVSDVYTFQFLNTY